MKLTIDCEKCNSKFESIFPSNEDGKLNTLINFLEMHKRHLSYTKIYTKKGNILRENIRPMILYLNEWVYPNMEKNLVGIEIGTAGGDNAKNMFESLSMEKLYIIDPYVPYLQDTKKIDYSPDEIKMKSILKDYWDKIIFYRDYSENVYNKIPDNSIDFIYIDGNHQYEFVKKDLELYYKKLKNFGVIGGHDFCTDSIGVIKAVIEFQEKHSEEFSDIKQKKHAREPDWWLIKK